jgi:RNA recognition motif-containing protein
MATKSLYVGNLPYDTTEEELRSVFAEFGPVAEIRLIGEKGFAFVDIPSERVSEAITATNGRQLGGRSLRVDEAKPRQPRESGSFSGRAGGGYGGSRSGSASRGGYGAGRERSYR